MKKIAVLWLIVFVVAAISIAFTHQYLISPLWVVNALAGFYLLRIRKQISHPAWIFLFNFSAVFLASYIFDHTKVVETKAWLAAIGAVQIQCLMWVYTALALNLRLFKYRVTAFLVVPTALSSLLGSVLFMLLFDVGENYYEFIDYFLEQVTTGLAVICMLVGIRSWNQIAWQEYFYLAGVSVLQYLISMDRIFYACLILPLLMCFYALRHSIREFAWLIGLIVLLCSVYVSLPLAGEYWTEAEVHMLSRISAYRLSLAVYLIIFLFICEMYIVNRRLYKALERVTFVDELTQLRTRRYIKELIDQLPLQQGSAILLDIDDFKQVNDNYGHPVGDLVLKHMAKILQSVCPNDAIVARWGGEEFLVLLPYMNRVECALLCQCIVDACEEHRFIHNDIDLSVSFSLGASSFKYFNTTNYADVLRKTDYLLYQAKGQGKKQFVYG